MSSASSASAIASGSTPASVARSLSARSLSACSSERSSASRRASCGAGGPLACSARISRITAPLMSSASSASAIASASTPASVARSLSARSFIACSSERSASLSAAWALAACSPARALLKQKQPRDDGRGASIAAAAAGLRHNIGCFTDVEEGRPPSASNSNEAG